MGQMLISVGNLMSLEIFGQELRSEIPRHEEIELFI